MGKGEGGLNILPFVRLGDLSFKIRGWLQSQVSSPAIYELNKVGQFALSAFSDLYSLLTSKCYDCLAHISTVC